MNEQEKELVLRYQPRIYQDIREPFPVRCIGCTVFTERKRSESFPKWVVDPAESGAEIMIEYAVYYDYDIQHLYDLEHIWVGIDEAGKVIDCWSSFHGMRLRASGVSCFRMEGEHPVLFSQPGKHAMLPSPELFGLHPEFLSACTSGAGGGLLVPALFSDVPETNSDLDSRICSYIRRTFAFTPSMKFRMEQLSPEQFVSWQDMRSMIPEFIAEQLRIIG